MKNILPKYKTLFHSAIKREVNPTALLTGCAVAGGVLWIVSVLLSLLGHWLQLSALTDLLAWPFVLLFCAVAIAYPILTIMNLDNAENNESWWANLCIAVIWGGLIGVSIFMTVNGITV